MPVTDEDVRHARDVVAEIISTHDPKYAPLFEILDSEVKRRETRAELIKKTLSKTDLTKMRELRRKRQKNRSGRRG